MANQENTPQNSPDENMPEITLSSALLAPLGSIFEAQIHSARSFLNFLLQMGFRHQYTEEEKEDLEENNPEEYSTIIEGEEGRKEIQEILKKKRDLEADNQTLPRSDVQRLKELNAKHGNLFSQIIEYYDDAGNEMMLNIPNLALLPVKPLSINEAEFSYEFEVSKTKEWTNRQGENWVKEDKKGSSRPWYLIKEPKSLRGRIGAKKVKSKEETESSSAISIRMKIGTTEMPYGLEKLMVHLTNSSEVIETKDSNNSEE